MNLTAPVIVTVRVALTFITTDIIGSRYSLGVHIGRVLRIDIKNTCFIDL